MALNFMFFGKRLKKRLWLMLVYLTVIMGACIILIPLVWMISTALKPLGEVLLFPPKWIPKPPQWRNFLDGWKALPFTIFLRNTLIITFTSLIGQVLSASLVAYGFARFRAPGRDLLFIVLLSTMMVPGQVRMIPTYILFRMLGWVNTFKPLIIPTFFGGGPFFIFLLRQFFMTIPVEYDEAAKIDGCNSLWIFLRVILPLSKPALTAVSIFSFMDHWNDFMNPLIYLHSQERYTLALGLRMMNVPAEGGLVPWHHLMAVSLLVTLPCILIFFFAQKYFIQGVVVTGLKE